MGFAQMANTNTPAVPTNTTQPGPTLKALSGLRAPEPIPFPGTSLWFNLADVALLLGIVLLVFGQSNRQRALTDSEFDLLQHPGVEHS